MQKFFSLIGPTSTGKTSLALKLCKKFDGEVVSFDSRQIYKHMDVGTGKIPINSDYRIKKGENFWEIDGIKIWGYDVVNPNIYFSAFDFRNFFSQIKFTKKVVFLTGGTGFYLDVLLGSKKVAGVSPDMKLRESLSKLSKEELFEKLKSLNPKWEGKIDKDNPTRLVRAIEIETYNAQHETREIEPEKSLQCELKIGLTTERASIYKRVDEWVDNIFENGFLQEVTSLIDMDFGDSKPMQGLNYKTASSLLKGELKKEEALERIKFDNHAYIRRQQTYFKKMGGVEWFDIGETGFDSQVKSLVESSLNG